jgi:hypothetical protein
MNEGQEHEWHIELAHMRAQLGYALENIDSISKRYEVELKIEEVLFRLKDLCELTKGETNGT